MTLTLKCRQLQKKTTEEVKFEAEHRWVHIDHAVESFQRTIYFLWILRLVGSGGDIQSLVFRIQVRISTDSTNGFKEGNSWFVQRFVDPRKPDVKRFLVFIDLPSFEAGCIPEKQRGTKKSR